MCPLLIATNSFRGIRGRTVVCAVLDECAYYRTDAAGAAPDLELYTALKPALARVPGSLLIGISSPYRRSGLLFEQWGKFYGRNDDDVLVIRGRTSLFNPRVDQRMIDSELARDPERAASERLAEWRSDISDFIGRDLLDPAVNPGVVVRPPQPGITYHAFADPSGGRGDSFAVAIAHGEGDLVVLDALYERRAPFNPGDVLGEIAELLRSYGIVTITGDKYAAGWVLEGFAKHGIRYQASERDRNAIYLDALPLFAGGRCG